MVSLHDWRAKLVSPLLLLALLIAAFVLLPGSLRAASPRLDFAWVRPPASKADADALLTTLLLPSNRSEIAICATIHNEGRFLVEWILYNLLVGTDHFYLYHQYNSADDETMMLLGPFIQAGIVVVHNFVEDQGPDFQPSSLLHCSETYGAATEWLLNVDADEFPIVTPTLTARSLDRSTPSIFDPPVLPLLEFLQQPLYAQAGAIVMSRQTFRNQGIQRLPDGASVLATQILRDLRHAPSAEDTTFMYTKSAAHTRHTTSWYIPAPHELRHPSPSAANANIINVMGTPHGEVRGEGWMGPGYSGELIYMGLSTVRVYEPLILYHYIERDTDNCIDKHRQIANTRPSAWRALAGISFCVAPLMLQTELRKITPPLTDADSFDWAAVADTTMRDSWYGLHLPVLMRSARRRAMKEGRGRGGDGMGRVVRIETMDIPVMRPA